MFASRNLSAGSRRDVFIALVSVLLLVLAPSGRSFWIDECTMGVLATQPSYGQLQATLAQVHGSEHLMPLTLYYYWSYEKLAGGSEWALRCGNLPWLALALVCMTILGRRIGWPWLPLLFAVHPFVWYYADEVRPYAIQLGTGSLLALGFVQLLQSHGTSRVGLLNFSLGCFLSVAASFLGVFTVIGAGLVGGCVAVRRRWSLPLAFWILLGLFVTPCIVLAVVLLAQRGSATGDHRLWTVSPLNVIFSLYEMLGFAGLGPSRYPLRDAASLKGLEGALPLLLPTAARLLPLLACYAVLLVWAIWPMRVRRDREGLALPSLAVIVLNMAGLFGASLMLGFPFWGRHLTPSVPFLILGLGVLASHLAQTQPRRAAGFFVLLGVLLLTSSLQLRFNPAYNKDDYRQAAATARQAVDQGLRVCWVAAPFGAYYYHLPLSHVWPPTPGTASDVIPQNLSEPGPHLMLVTKSDIFDYHNLRRLWLARPGTQVDEVYPGFTVYSLTP